MENMFQEKNNKLNKIVCVRMTDDDYYTLLQISQNNQSRVSKIIRIVVNNLIDLVPKNNIEGK